MRGGATVLLTLAGAALVEPAGAAIRLDLVPEESGVTAPMVCGVPGKPSILDGTGPGLALLDFDGDGWLDLYLLNGGTRYEPDPIHTPNVLYRNLGGWRFEDVTARAGVGDRHFSHGSLAADLDGDGAVELLVTNYGSNVLYRNRGDGTFEERAAAAGLASEGWHTGATFLDMERDGDLDVYIARYIVFDPVSTPRLGNSRCVFMGFQVFCGPRGLPPAQDQMFRNRGDASFEDVTVAAGMHREEPFYGLGAIASDLDDDGLVDVYVADDATPNLLYRNHGDGTFSEEALLRGVAVSVDGSEQAGMGIDVGDYDGDERLDIVVTNFSHDTHTLYRNLGPLFEVTTFQAGLGSILLPDLGWGVGFIDFDADGWDDLFFSHGHVHPQVDGRGVGTSWKQQNRVFRNRGDGTFEDVTAHAGPGMAVRESSRGAVFGDLDEDGDPDVVVGNMDTPPTLLRNDAEGPGSWVGLVLHGRPPNVTAVGARAALVAGGRRRIKEVHAGSGYLSQSDLRLRFGLGDAAGAEAAEVRWPDGARSRYRGLSAGRYLHLYHPGLRGDHR